MLKKSFLSLPVVWHGVGAAISQRAVEEATIVGIESGSHFVGKRLQVPKNPVSSLFWPGIDENWMVQDGFCEFVSQSNEKNEGLNFFEFFFENF